MNICVIGLGYVGLPLALALSKKWDPVYGFDVSETRIDSLKKNCDESEEVTSEQLNDSKLILTSDPSILKESDFIIVAVPTPIDDAKKPNLKPLLDACKTIAKNLKKDSIIVFESTVYPGCTEHDCVPVLEKESGMKYLEDFKVGYSPERIVPGDKLHTLDLIVKVVSACDGETLQIVSDVYSSIISAGIHKAPSIKVAEAAKIIENTQRDINIALMNELKMIFDKVDINWKEVLEAAKTKWNFLDFKPGLVGGHCIGVDPYYLAYNAEKTGTHPDIILSARRINDDMAKYETTRLVKYLVNNDIKIKGLKILLLGATFKPNVSDLRNSKVKDVVKELKGYDCQVDICEPHIIGEVFGCKNIRLDEIKGFDMVIKVVDHDIFRNIKTNYEILQ